MKERKFEKARLKKHGIKSVCAYVRSSRTVCRVSSVSKIVQPLNFFFGLKWKKRKFLNTSLRKVRNNVIHNLKVTFTHWIHELIHLGFYETLKLKSGFHKIINVLNIFNFSDFSGNVFLNYSCSNVPAGDITHENMTCSGSGTYSYS